jgi:alkylation response protein AidB-like acyl-CoA dehydrogenase
MRFQFSEEQERFRQEVRDFFDRELPANWTVGEWLPEESLETEDDWALFSSLRRKMAEKGWLSMWWPKEYGGQERSRVEFAILREEIFYRGVPGFDGFGSMMLAPLLLTYGTEEQKRKHLPRIARAEVRWCQGFSEPNAGSDLASLTTRAVEDGDYFVINGQKCWTSVGHRADWVFLLVRTDPTVPKHKGLSFLLVDLKTPGITMNPVYNLLGHRHWNEVFFDGVSVPKENLVGEKNQGWYVAAALLNIERSAIETCAGLRRALDRLLSYVKERDTLASNPVIRQKLAALATKVEVCRLLCYRTVWLEDKGLNPAYESSMGKAFAADLIPEVADAGLQVLGLYGQLGRGSKWAPLNGAVEQVYLAYPPWALAGGSPEAQKNIIATMGLGLPR